MPVSCNVRTLNENDSNVPLILKVDYKATLGKSGSEAASQLRGRIESIFQQQFGEYHGYDGCYSIYFDSSTIVRLSGLL